MIADVFSEKAAPYRTPAVEDMLRRVWQREAVSSARWDEGEDAPRPRNKSSGGRGPSRKVHERRLIVANLWRKGMTEGEIANFVGATVKVVSHDVAESRKSPETYGEVPLRRGSQIEMKGI